MSAQAYIPYDLYPEFPKSVSDEAFSSAIRLRALFFPRCIIAANVLARSEGLARALLKNKQLVRDGHVQLAVYRDGPLFEETLRESSITHTENLGALEELEPTQIRYDVGSATNGFRSEVLGNIKAIRQRSRSCKILQALDDQIKIVDSSTGEFNLSDALALRTNSYLDSRLRSIAFEAYATVGSKSVFASPIISSKTWKAANSIGSVSTTAESALAEAGHGTLLEAFSMRGDVLDLLTDVEFGEFVQLSTTQDMIAQLRSVLQAVLETKSSVSNLQQELKILEDAKREIRMEVARQIGRERAIKSGLDWGSTGLDDLAGLILPGAGVGRKVLRSLGVGSLKGKFSPTPLHTYVAELQEIRAKATLRAYKR